MPDYNILPENLTRWQIVLKAAHEFGKEIFSANDLVKKIQENRPDVPVTSIRTYVIAMAPNHPSYHHYPIHHPHFEFLGNRKYKLMSQEGLPPTAATTLTHCKADPAPVVDTTKGLFLLDYFSIISCWTKKNLNALISGRKNYRWKDNSLAESIEKRNQLSRQIVLSRIRNNGGVDIDTLDKIMEWGFPKNPQFAERDPKKCLEITRHAFNLLDGVMSSF